MVVVVAAATMTARRQRCTDGSAGVWEGGAALLSGLRIIHTIHTPPPQAQNHIKI